MFNFFKKSHSLVASEGLVNLSQDIHSHILPGIDDGAPDIDTSLHLLQGLYDLGIRKTVATPHVIGDLYRNTPETINNALAKLKLACLQAGLNMEISAAAEYMLDDHFMGLLRKNEPLLTIFSDVILTEISYMTPPDNLEEIAFEIITSGYQPIMAHPERYIFYHRNYDNFERLKELGFLLQVNLLSLTGYYGPQVSKAAKFLIEKDLADFVGTDMHHDRHLQLLSEPENLGTFEKLLGKKIFNTFEITAK